MKKIGRDPRKIIESYALLVKLYASRLPIKLFDLDDVNRVHSYKAAGLIDVQISPAVGVTPSFAVVNAITAAGILAIQGIPLDWPSKVRARNAR